MKILVFGGNGMVGSSVVRTLNKNDNYKVISSSRNDTNLFSFEDTNKTISEINPNLIINAAAKVGGIIANNTFRSDFILNNLKINMNIIESLKKFPNIKLINLGSSCIYPLGAEVPIKESSLMKGPLEPTNSPYAMAKLAAIEMGDALEKEFGHSIINLMPTNLYGPNDNFSENESHVIPGLIHRMYLAKINNLDEFLVWGTGSPLREFLFVDDLAHAISFLIENETKHNLLNVGSNDEISIADLVLKIKEVIGFTGEIKFDSSKPDGNPRKLLDSSRIAKLGWEPKVGLDDGLGETFNWYKKNII